MPSVTFGSNEVEVLRQFGTLWQQEAERWDTHLDPFTNTTSSFINATILPLTALGMTV